ncbi:hypothetical protein A6X29_003898 [Salmonella enterica subsp. enterica serovar Cerro]|nr:hypothetical protein [Salmonella enterica subsp. enterica serovar Cerro]EEE0690253.1 hypothetical protein [Salmonella enterica subsp. enterica serovar Cerro]EKC9969433.1 hypothetical protein [Salmonella enterica]
MNIIYDEKDKIYKAVKITGPRHNFLGLVFSDTPVELEIVNLEEKKPSYINEPQLIDAVLKGIQEGSAHSNFPYTVQKILYVGSDSPWYEAYELLSFEIAQEISRKK